MSKKAISKSDILTNDAYVKVRPVRRAQVLDLKKKRRLSVGPYATLYFENFDTLWYQIQEMLLVEHGGPEQVEDELAAYGPMVPSGHELCATLMFEVEDVTRRQKLLRQWTNIENTLGLSFGGQKVMATPFDDGQERTQADGKTSAVHFVKFSLSAAQISLFKAPSTDILVGFYHENYEHIAVMAPGMKAALAADLEG